MLEFFSSIGDIVATAIDFLVSSIVNIVRVFGVIPDALGFLMTCINLLPSFVIVFVVAGVVTSVIFLVIGR